MSGGVLGPDYDEAEVEALHAEVLPKYLSFFNALAVDRLVLAPQASVLACGALTSSVVDSVSERLPGAVIRALEPSTAAAKGALERISTAPPAIEFEAVEALPLPHADGSYTHAVVIHPIASLAHRLSLLKDAARLLVPAGQLLFVLPLRGSYPEIADMLREFSLKHDNPRFGEAVEVGAQSRPTPETLTEDLERLGFEDVAVDVELLSVPFESGRDFTAHPLFRLIVAPELAASIEGSPGDVQAAIEYAKTAIGKYWSEGPFDLTVNLGCASARKPSGN